MDEGGVLRPDEEVDLDVGGVGGELDGLDEADLYAAVVDRGIGGEVIKLVDLEDNDEAGLVGEGGFL